MENIDITWKGIKGSLPNQVMIVINLYCISFVHSQFLVDSEWYVFSHVKNSEFSLTHLDMYFRNGVWLRMLLSIHGHSHVKGND